MGLTPNRLAILIDASGTKALGEFSKVTSASKALEEQTKKTNIAMAKAMNSPSDRNTGLANSAQQVEFNKRAALGAAQTQILGKTALVAGGAMLAGFGLAEKAAMGFDKAMSAVNATSDLTSKQFDQLRAAALSTGQQFGLSATSAANAEQQLLKTGLSVSDVLSGGLKNALALATAGSLDVGDAAQIAAQAMNAFGLSGSDFGHVADVLASGANKSASTVAGLGDAISQVGPLARQMGLNLDQTVGALDMFAQKGSDAGDAGTALRQFLLKLNPTSKTAQEGMKQLGLEMFDAQGNFVGLGAAADQLKAKFGGLSQQQQLAALTSIFGARAAKSAIPFVQEGAKALTDAALAVGAQGSAADLAAKKLDNLSGDIHKLGSAINTDLIKSADGASGGLRVLVHGVTGLVNVIGGAPAPVQQTVGVLAGLAGAALTVGGTMAVMAPKIAKARDMLESMGAAGRVASSGLGALGTGSLVVGGLVAVGAAVNYVTDRIANANRADIPKLTSDLLDLGNTGKLSGTALSAFGVNTKDLAAGIVDVQSAAGKMGIVTEGLAKFGGIFSSGMKQHVNAVHDLDKALTGLATSGHGAQAAAVLKAVQDQLAAGGHADEAKALPGILTSYSTALDASDLAARQAAGGTGILSTAQQQLNLTLDDSGNAVDTIGNKYDAAGNKILSMADQVDKLDSAIEGQIRAQHAYDVSVQGIKTAQDAAAEATTKLNKLLRDGAVDQTALAAATLSNEKALKGVTDANEKLTKANQDLTKAQTPATALELLAAQDQITASAIKGRQAQDTLTAAIKKRDDIQKALDRGQTLGNPDDIVIAQQNVTDSTKNYTKVLKDHKSTAGDIATAHKAMVDAQTALTDAQTAAIPTTKMLQDAEDDVTTASIGVDSANVDAEASTKALTVALAKGSDTDPAVIAARQGVTDATENLGVATDSAKASAAALTAAAAGDPDWAAKVTAARGNVRDTTNGLKDAQWGAYDAAVALKNKTDEEKDAFIKWGGAIDGVKDKLTQLKRDHPEIAGSFAPIFDAIANLIGTANLSNAAAPGGGIGPVPGLKSIRALASGGITTGKMVAMIGEAGPEAVIPLDRLDGLTGGSGGGTNVYITVQGALDPNAVARQIDQIMTQYNRGGQAAFLNN